MVEGLVGLILSMSPLAPLRPKTDQRRRRSWFVVSWRGDDRGSAGRPVRHEQLAGYSLLAASVFHNNFANQIALVLVGE
jgi:hypothetical protein